MDAHLRTSNISVIAWFDASAASVGGDLGTGLESDDAIRAATCSKREEERRRRIDDGQP